MAGKLCIYVRDSQHRADLYDSHGPGHNFRVTIREAGSYGTVWWNGVNYDDVWLTLTGEFGALVAGEFAVPAGTYLVLGHSCTSDLNINTQIAWVQVNDGETISVNLVTTPVWYCVHAAIAGAVLGTAIVNANHVPLAQIAPAEVKAFEKAANALAAKLPKEAGMQLMSVEELQKRLRETPQG